MGSSFGKSTPAGEKTKTVTQEASVPGYLQGGIQAANQTGVGALGGLSSLLQGKSGQDLVAGFNPDQLQSMEMLRGIAGGQGGILPDALNALQSTARGDYLYGGEGFNAAVDAAQRAAQPGILSLFGGAHRGTGGLAQAAIARSFADPFAQQYGQERGHQLNAAQLLPQASTYGAGLLGQIGQQQQGLAQQQINAPIAGQTDLLNAARGGVPISQLVGMTQTASEPLFQNKTAGALGGGLQGAQAGAELGSFFGPWGTLAGAGIGAAGGGYLGSR